MLAPPKTFIQRLKYLGPGFILSAAIVGSGELIATTALGAKAGFITFWVVLVSCLVKVTLQLEFGKNAIYMNLLAIYMPNIEIYASSISQATALGTALAINEAWNSNPVPNDIIQFKYYSSIQQTL